MVAAPRRRQQVGGDRFGDQLVAEPYPALAALSGETPVGSLDEEPVLEPFGRAGRDVRLQTVTLVTAARTPWPSASASAT